LTYSPDILGDEESLVRFAPERKSHFRPSDGSVKPKAFQPETRVHHERKVTETSVSRVDGCVDKEIWQLGDEACRNRGKVAQGYSQIAISSVRKTGLGVMIDEPPLRHAVINDWPSDESEIEARMKLLAAEAKFVHRPQT
jgi:hypothetical protein